MNTHSKTGYFRYTFNYGTIVIDSYLQHLSESERENDKYFDLMLNIKASVYLRDLVVTSNENHKIIPF